MDVSWLQDFLALAETGNFSRAAALRNITQPAFSRRIRLLEDWVGAALVDRSTHQAALTPAGERFRPAATEVLRRLLLGQEEAREAAQANAATLRFAATHALSLTFFPAWLRALEDEAPVGAVSLAADHMQACEALMLQGRANFLLCHHHPAAASLLDPKSFISICLGADVLMPVSAPGPDGSPLHALPGRQGQPAPFLAFTGTSGMGRILAACQHLRTDPLWLETVFTSHVATVLKSMARDGRGMAWAPYSLAADDLAAGALVRAGAAAWDVPIEIHLFRPRSRQSQAAETFWSRLAPGARAGSCVTA